jgi:hypothetical protein
MYSSQAIILLGIHFTNGKKWCELHDYLPLSCLLDQQLALMSLLYKWQSTLVSIILNLTSALGSNLQRSRSQKHRLPKEKKKTMWQEGMWTGTQHPFLRGKILVSDWKAKPCPKKNGKQRWTQRCVLLKLLDFKDRPKSPWNSQTNGLSHKLWEEISSGVQMSLSYDHPEVAGKHWWGHNDRICDHRTSIHMSILNLKIQNPKLSTMTPQWKIPHLTLCDSESTGALKTA